MRSAGVQKMALESVGVVVAAVCCHSSSSRVYKWGADAGCRGWGWPGATSAANQWGQVLMNGALMNGDRR